MGGIVIREANLVFRKSQRKFSRDANDERRLTDLAVLTDEAYAPRVNMAADFPLNLGRIELGEFFRKGMFF